MVFSKETVEPSCTTLCLITMVLAGPPGTGKTVVLLLKARQWLTEGHDVHVVSMLRESIAVAYYLYKALNQKHSTQQVGTQVFVDMSSVLFCGYVKCPVLWICQVSCFVDMSSVLFCGYVKCPVLWICQVSCFVDMSSVLFCGYVKCPVLWICQVPCFVDMSSVLFCGYVKCPVLWICQVSCFVDMSSVVFCGYVKCRVLWICQVSCFVDMSSVLFCGYVKCPVLWYIHEGSMMVLAVIESIMKEEWRQKESSEE